MMGLVSTTSQAVPSQDMYCRTPVGVVAGPGFPGGRGEVRSQQVFTDMVKEGGREPAVSTVVHETCKVSCMLTGERHEGLQVVERFSPQGGRLRDFHRGGDSPEDAVDVTLR
jgi:hypothetical protein